MRECPFCHAKPKFKHPYLGRLSTCLWTFTHHCNMTFSELDVCISVYGKTKREVLDKWDGLYEEQTSESL